jgi:ferrous iron transport protein B
LQNFDLHLNLVSDSGESILAIFGSILAPLFAPLGFNDWRIPTALITGFIAKESVVSTLNILSAMSVLNTKTAAVFLVFTLLYTPCVAAIASVKRELGGKSAVYVVIAQCVIAWIVAFLAHTVIAAVL